MRTGEAASAAAEASSTQTRARRRRRGMVLRVHYAVHPVDGFVDFGRALVADGHGIHGAEIHDELHRGLAILGSRESAFAAELHADHTHALGVDLLRVSHHFVHVAGYIDI